MSIVNGQPVNQSASNAAWLGQEYITAGLTTTVTSGGTTVLTSTSSTSQQFTGVLTQTVKLPDATSLAVGRLFKILNRSTGIITVNYQDGTICTTVAAASQKDFQVVSIGTTNGTWDAGVFPSASSPTVGTVKSNALINLGLSVTASSGTMTIALKQNDGSTDPSSGSGAVLIAFRDSTSASGDYVLRSVTAALSLSLAGASTLGAASGTAVYVYIYAFDNAGTVTLGAAIIPYDEGSVQSSSTTANSNQVIYQASALTGKPVRLIGRFKATNTSSSWGSPTEVSLQPFENLNSLLGFKATGASTATVNGNVTLVNGTVRFDPVNMYNAATGVATIPKAGKWVVMATYGINGGQTLGTGQYYGLNVKQNGVDNLTPQQTVWGTGTVGAQPGVSLPTVIDCAVGDTVSITLNSNVALNGQGNYSSFSLFRIGG